MVAKKSQVPEKHEFPMENPYPDEEVGYARVSTPGQSQDMQIAALKERGIPDVNIFADVASGGKMQRRNLERALKLMTGRPGWTLVVWKLDRLGRTVMGLLELAKRFERERWNLVSITEQIDTRTPFGRFYFHMLAVLAQLERDMAIERTKAGMAKRKADGAKLGRISRLTQKDFDRMEKAILTTTKPLGAIAKEFGMNAMTLHYHFPAWRSKSPKARAAYRKQHPINVRQG